MRLLSLCAALGSAAAGATEAEDNSLLWGPYRPNVYFGMRPQIPESLLTGLMWYSNSDLGGLGHIRHDCTNDDKVAKFGWTQYDPRLGGRQVIDDTEHHVNLTTDLVKSADGLAWEVRIRGDQSPDSILTLVYYAGLEAPAGSAGSRDFMTLHPRSKNLLSSQGIPGDVRLKGYAGTLGGAFELTVSKGSGSKPTHRHEWADQRPATRSHYTSLQIPTGHVWQARDIYLTLVQDQVNQFLAKYGDAEVDIPVWSIFSLDNDDRLGGNTHFIQKTFQGPFEFSVRFEPEASEGFAKDLDFDARLKSVLDAQREKFDGAFSLNKPFNTQKHHNFAREMISNLAGGIGYFYGDSLVETDDGVEHAPPHELFTGTPSRTFFPRGFYWDEGFNLLGLMPYDEDLTLKIFDSWFNAMDEDGWIAREQILGDEGRSRVPPEFQNQNPEFANPPTIVMALAHIGTSSSSPDLTRLYPLLKKHFEWFRSTQRGETTSVDRELPAPREAYRWRGRSQTHILTSGLDDYPRAAEPSDGELHVDLLSWIGAMATSLAQIADITGNTADAAKYREIISGVQKNLLTAHWNDEAAAFCDISIDEYEEDMHVCHIGYVTHLPFMLRLVPETSEKQLLAILEQLRDPEQLWSVGGIRSLSKKDPYFGTEENYWRGPVWNNMNYLTLDALQHYASAESKASAKVKELAADIYKKLRRNVGNNIYKQWKASGYVWESYEATTGAPKGAKQFTGWAALVANIMAMPESLSVPGAGGAGGAGGAAADGHDEL